MSAPKVSICIPTYDNAEQVKRLLDSVSAQTFQDFEVIITDDSEDDAVEDVVTAWKKGRKDVTYVHNETPLGHIFNWNKALEMAKGEYIKIMFSDDWFTDEQSLARFVYMLDKNPDAILAFSGSKQVELDHGMNSFDRYASDSFIRKMRADCRHLFVANEIGAPSAVIYRRQEPNVLFDEQSNKGSDMFVYFDLLLKNPQFAYTKKPLTSIGIHSQQFTAGFSKKDMRRYESYRHMYVKYNLRKSKECREYFARNFSVKFGKGPAEAMSLGISPVMYLKAAAQEVWNNGVCYVRHHFFEK